MSDVEQRVTEHYGSFGQLSPILAALAKRGMSAQGVTPAQLAPFDQFHTGGAVATRRLADLLAPRPSDHILDLGCGLGGPARMLADLKGCTVAGLDLASNFIETATYLSALTDQFEKVKFQQGSAMALPFPDAYFDGAWQLHVGMNVAEKNTMYAEVFRVLKAGAAFVVHDPLRSGSGNVVFPVPWATELELSFLETQDAMLSHLEAVGFEIVEASDATAEGLAWFDEMDAARRKPSSRTSKSDSSRALTPLEIMTKNHRANLESGAVTIVTVQARKRA
jgi:sarcosine/dimethylglycine N-methyltransferase